MSTEKEYSRIYRIICVYDGPKHGVRAISELDGAPGYLHMHVLDSSLLKDAALPESKGESGTLYQWGTPQQQATKTRRPIVSDAIARRYGSVGIGSAASGWREDEGAFKGAGEGFVYGSDSYRITRGNSVFPVPGEGRYWTLQVSAFKNAITTDKITSATSRDNLKEQIHSALNLGDVGFIATFLARFEKDSFVARSNGVLPDDAVTDKTMDVFPLGAAIGGHVIGDSDNIGDKMSEKNVKSPEITGGVHVRLKIEGDVRIEAIKEIAIAEEKDPDKFRKARLREVKDAATPMRSKL